MRSQNDEYSLEGISFSSYEGINEIKFSLAL